MFDLERVLSDGCDMLAPYRRGADPRNRPARSVTAYLEANISKVFAFDRSDIGAYFAAFPEIWLMEFRGNVESMLKIAVTNAVQRSILLRLDGGTHDIGIPHGPGEIFPAVVLRATMRILQRAETNGLYEGGRISDELVRLKNMIEVLCVRILRDVDPNDFRLLNLNIGKLADLLGPARFETGAWVFPSDIIVPYRDLADYAAMVSSGERPLPVRDRRWDAELLRAEKLRSRNSGSTDAAPRHCRAMRYADDPELCLEEFEDCYAMTPEMFMVVKMSVEQHFGMMPGTAMQFMIIEFGLSLELWEDGFVEISNALATALRQSGRIPSVLLPKAALEAAVQECFGRTHFDEDIVPHHPYSAGVAA